MPRTPTFMVLLAIVVLVADVSAAATELKISGASPAEAHLIRDGAADAMRFLGRCGLAVSGGQTVVVDTHLEAAGGLKNLAAYNPISKIVSIVRLDSGGAQKQGDAIYAMIPAASFYKSLVAHEIAHAIVFDTLGSRRIQRNAHEYIAYVVQFATLEAELREKIVSTFASSARFGLEAFSELMLLMAPHRFGLEAYMHFQREKNGCRFLRDIVWGRVWFPVQESSSNLSRPVARQIAPTPPY